MTCYFDRPRCYTAFSTPCGLRQVWQGFEAMAQKLRSGASVPTKGAPAILSAINKVAASYEVDPAAIAGVIHTESVWDTKSVTGSYIGLTQVGPELPKKLGLTKAEFLNLS